MPVTRFHSATDLLVALVGEDGEGLENEEDYEDGVADFDDDVPAYTPKFIRPTNAKHFKKFLTTRDERECSICMDTDCEFVSLACKCQVCSTCLAEYIKLEVRELRILKQTMSWMIPGDKNICYLRFQTIYGLRCPSLGCYSLIEEPIIRPIVDKYTYARYDNFVLNAVVQDMGELKKCPFNCGGVIQEDCMCSTPECRERIAKARSNIIKQRKVTDESKRQYLALASSISIRCCPSCNVAIEKNMGCDHMFCSRCNKAFLWSQAPTLAACSTNWIHNISSQVQLPGFARAASDSKLVMEVLKL